MFFWVGLKNKFKTKERKIENPFHFFSLTVYLFIKFLFIYLFITIVLFSEWMYFGWVRQGACGVIVGLYINVNKLSENFGKIKSCVDGETAGKEFESLGHLLEVVHAEWVQCYHTLQQRELENERKRSMISFNF